MLVGVRISEIGQFDILLDGVKIAMSFTYALVRVIVEGVTKVAAQGRKLPLASIESNQLKFFGERGGPETENQKRDENVASDHSKDEEQSLR